MAAYNSWKMEAHNAREQLKSNIAETQFAIVVDTLEDAKNDVIRIYDEIRQSFAPSAEIR